MVIEAPVLDETGNVVLREGVQLTRKIIAALKHRGVTRISVNAPGGETGESKTGLTEEEKARMCRQIERRIDRVFAGQNDKTMLELAAAAKRYHKSKIK